MKTLIKEVDAWYSQMSTCIRNYKKTGANRFSISYIETKLNVLSNCWQNIFEKHHELLVKYIDSDKELAYFTAGVYDSYEEEFYEAKFIMEEKLESLRMEKSATGRLDGYKRSRRNRYKSIVRSNWSFAPSANSATLIQR